MIAGQRCDSIEYGQMARGGEPAPDPLLGAIILAAGRSKRMKSDLVKVLHPVCDRPMVAWVVDACLQAGASRVIIIVGHQGDAVRKFFAGCKGIEFVEQREQLGTGHAVDQTRKILSDFRGDVFVLAGDGPLIRTRTLRDMLVKHRNSNAAATLATARIAEPTGYGRIVRDRAGRFDRIVEEKDATESERKINEINPSYYCFSACALFEALGRITNENVSGEYYLTDVCGLLRQSGLRVELLDTVDPRDVHSVNTPEQLAHVSSILQSRLAAGGLHR